MTSTDWRYWDALTTSFLSIFLKMLFHIVVFSILTICKHRYVGKHAEGNSFYICIKFAARRPKEVWKMSLADVRIMMFYRRSDNLNVTYSIKFITITFLKYSFSVPSRSKNNQFIQCLINFGETSQRRPNSVLKWRIWDVPGTSLLHIIQNTLLLYYFRSYSANMVHEILKS